MGTPTQPVPSHRLHPEGSSTHTFSTFADLKRGCWMRLRVNGRERAGKGGEDKGQMRLGLTTRSTICTAGSTGAPVVLGEDSVQQQDHFGG